MKPLIVGEAPGKNGDPSKPIEGRVGARLADCCGLTLDEFLAAFERVNLLDEQPQDSGKGASFDVRQAGRVTRELEKTFAPGQVVLLLGKRVARAFRISCAEYFDWFALNHAQACVVPHPSGVNRWWNEPENELQMRRFMRNVAKELT